MQLRSVDSPPLELPTDRAGVVLRELSTPEDDRAYFDAVAESRPELDEREGIGQKYTSLEDVANARLHSDRRTKIRMGVWRENVFVGSVNVTLDEDESTVEIGYWTRTGHTGNQYATLAARALAAYVAPHAARVIAEAAADNIASIKALEHAGFREARERTAHQAGYIAYELALRS